MLGCLKKGREKDCPSFLVSGLSLFGHLLYREFGDREFRRRLLPASLAILRE